MNPLYGGPTLEELRVTPEQVKDKLRDLRPAASPSPDAGHPKVLRELVAPYVVLGRPLQPLLGRQESSK